MTRKELSRTYDLFHKGYGSNRIVKKALLDVLEKLTDEEQTKVIEQVAILVFCKPKAESKPDLGMMLPMCRPDVPKHSFEYLMILDLDAHKDADSFRFTVGHEIAHLLLGHVHSLHHDRGREEAADHWCWEHGIYPEWVVTKPSIDISKLKPFLRLRKKGRVETNLKEKPYGQ
jgi:hypothetical protein